MPSFCPKKLAILLISLLALAGCASDYRAVREADLAGLKAQLEATQQALTQLEEEQAASRDLLFVAETESLHRMVAALEERIATPECPVVEDPPHCEPADVAPPSPRQSVNDKPIIGEVEQVFIDPPGAVYAARIDTGATTASLDAREIQVFERDGEEWVHFKMPVPGQDELAEVERKISHFVRIVQSSTDETERRPVIHLRIVIGQVERLAEFTLSNREHMEFPVLVGRNILKDTLVVDVSRSNSVDLPAEVKAAQDRQSGE